MTRFIVLIMVIASLSAEVMAQESLVQIDTLDSEPVHKMRDDVAVKGTFYIQSRIIRKNCMIMYATRQGMHYKVVADKERFRKVIYPCHRYELIVEPHMEKMNMAPYSMITFSKFCFYGAFVRINPLFDKTLETLDIYQVLSCSPL